MQDKVDRLVRKVIKLSIKEEVIVIKDGTDWKEIAAQQKLLYSNLAELIRVDAQYASAKSELYNRIEAIEREQERHRAKISEKIQKATGDNSFKFGENYL